MIDDPNLQAIARSKNTLKKTIVVGILFIVLCAITSGVVVFCMESDDTTTTKSGCGVSQTAIS